MELDARGLSDGTVLECDLCIVGGGPAGLTLAHALLDTAAQVVVLESGGNDNDAAAQDLNAGAVVGTAYDDLRRVRHRQVGGSANLWNTGVGDGMGAKYVPLDPIDFEQRPWLELSGWPFGAAELAPFYERAQRVCGLGRFDYDAQGWPRHGALAVGRPLYTRIYQFGRADPFVTKLPRAVASAPQQRLVHHATACRIRADAAGERALGVEAAMPAGARLEVRARTVVLAAGAIENARLLLVSNQARREGLGNASDWVGRCFMEHPRDFAIRWTPARPGILDEARFYDIHEEPCGTLLMGRLALAEDALRLKRLPQASVTLLPFAQHGPTLLARALRLALDAAGFRDSLLNRYPRGGAEWSRHPRPSAAYDTVRLLCNVEQFPNPDNRVVLGSTRDPLGVPRVELHWQWTRQDQARLAALRALLREGIESAGLGPVAFGDAAPNPLAHHHAGTTRMHVDPRMGVVDADGRVHGMENLYVTGASVFPTAGFANPTLTIVALALRLAEHLKLEA
jgi:choline dehydrogenase-like flavoprotein